MSLMDMDLYCHAIHLDTLNVAGQTVAWEDPGKSRTVYFESILMRFSKQRPKIYMKGNQRQNLSIAKYSSTRKKFY